MRYTIQFRRRTDSIWRQENRYSSLEQARAQVESTYLENDYNNRTRDYAIRLIDEDEHIYCQGGPAECEISKWIAIGAEIPETIHWNTPEQHLKESGEKVHMIKVGIRRLNGKLTLLVNAKEFHDELDKIGVQHSNNAYLDQPQSAASVATSTFQISPKVLLTRDYKEVDIKDGQETKKVPVTGIFDLSTIWMNPPSLENLKKLCNSAEPVARKILEHYQPIDISVEIHKKIVK